MDELRIGDAERERAAAELGEHYAQGRLTAPEHAERLDRIWTARTRGELAPVFSDLPRPAAAPAEPVRRRTPRRAGHPAGRPRLRVLPVLLVLVAFVVLGMAPWVLVLPIVALCVLAVRAPWSRAMR